MVMVMVMVSHTWLTHSPEQGEMVSHGPGFVYLMVFFDMGTNRSHETKTDDYDY
jgi:hypothetical protein